MTLFSFSPSYFRFLASFTAFRLDDRFTFSLASFRPRPETFIETGLVVPPQRSPLCLTRMSRYSLLFSGTCLIFSVFCYGGNPGIRGISKRGHGM